MFNNTCPCKDIQYAIYFTGKTYKRNSNIPGKFIWVNGEEFLKDTEEWLNDYNREFKNLLNKYKKSNNKKKLGGFISVYPRPNYSADISSFIKNSE